MTKRQKITRAVAATGCVFVGFLVFAAIDFASIAQAASAHFNGAVAKFEEAMLGWLYHDHIYQTMPR